MDRVTRAFVLPENIIFLFPLLSHSVSLYMELEPIEDPLFLNLSLSLPFSGIYFFSGVWINSFLIHAYRQVLGSSYFELSHFTPQKKIPFAGWATGLYAGESDWSLDFSFFKVGIDLTDAGHGLFSLPLFKMFITLTSKHALVMAELMQQLISPLLLQILILNSWFVL